MTYTPTLTAGTRCTSRTGGTDECIHGGLPAAALGSVQYDPTGAEDDMLHALEAAWRAAVTMDDTRAYSIAHHALTTMLCHLFGEHVGRVVRDEMADNFEAWGYNLCLVRQGVIGDLPASDLLTASTLA